MKETLKMSIKEAERLGTMRQVDKKKIDTGKSERGVGPMLEANKKSEEALPRARGKRFDLAQERKRKQPENR